MTYPRLLRPLAPHICTPTDEDLDGLSAVMVVLSQTLWSATSHHPGDVGLRQFDLRKTSQTMTTQKTGRRGWVGGSAGVSMHVHYSHHTRSRTSTSSTARFSTSPMETSVTILVSWAHGFWMVSCTVSEDGDFWHVINSCPQRNRFLSHKVNMRVPTSGFLSRLDFVSDSEVSRR